MEKIVQYLGWLVLVTLILAIARQLSETSNYNTVGNSVGMKHLEGFESMNTAPSGGMSGDPPAGASFSVGNVPDSSGRMNPASPQLESPYLPYTLRKDLPFKCDKGNLTSKTCYDSDFMPLIERTGNYNQLTNNYVHETPDSCTTPFTELVDSFYLNN